MTVANLNWIIVIACLLLEPMHPTEANDDQIASQKQKK